MIVQLVNLTGRVVDSVDVKLQNGSRPEWVFVNGAVFIFRARVGNLHRFVEAPGLIFTPAENGETPPATLVVPS